MIEGYAEDMIIMELPSGSAEVFPRRGPHTFVRVPFYVGPSINLIEFYKFWLVQSRSPFFQSFVQGLITVTGGKSELVAIREQNVITIKSS